MSVESNFCTKAFSCFVCTRSRTSSRSLVPTHREKTNAKEPLGGWPEIVWVEVDVVSFNMFHGVSLGGCWFVSDVGKVRDSFKSARWKEKQWVAESPNEQNRRVKCIENCMFQVSSVACVCCAFVYFIHQKLRRVAHLFNLERCPNVFALLIGG